MKKQCLTGLAVAITALTVQPQQVYTLDEIFAIAETASPQLRPSLTAITEAEKNIEAARTSRLPEINTSLSASYIGDGFTTRRGFDDYQRAPIPHLGNGLDISVSQPVYTGGAISSSIEMARLKTTAARYSAEMRRDDIRLRLTGDYLDLYKMNNLRCVVESNINAARRVLKNMEARYDQGTALRNDITRYELMVSDLELELSRIATNMDIINNDLVKTAGLPQQTKIIPDTTMVGRTLAADGNESWWLEEAETNSPTLAMSRTGIDISRRAESLVKSERLPQIGLQAGWNINGPILTEVPPINRNLSYWYVGIGIKYNLSSIYTTGKSLAKSRLATRRAEEEHRTALDELGNAIHADHARYRQAFSDISTREKAVELARSNYNVVETRYSEGMALITDLLDAANARLDAEQRLVNARIDILYYYYKLLFTAGKI